MTGRKWLRWSLIVLAALVLLAVGTLAFLPSLLDTPTIHAYLTQTAAHALGRPVKFVSFSVSLLPLPNVKLKGLEIADDPRFGTTPLLRVGEVRVGLRVKPLLSLRIEMASLTLDDARVELVEEGGRWNVASLAAPVAKPAARTVPGMPASAAMGSVVVSSVRLKGAAIHVNRRGVKSGDLRIEGIDATVSGVRGSELDIRGEARVEPGGIKVRDLRATVGMRGAGMPVKASLDLEGADIAPLVQAFLAAWPALSGPVKGKLEVSGTPERLAGTGVLDLSRVTLSQERRQCPPPARRQLVFDSVRVPVLLRPAAFESGPLSASLGKGTIAVKVTAGLDASPLVMLDDIKVTHVELLPVLQDYFCQGFAVSGPLDLGGELSMRTADVWRTMNGIGQFKIGAGRVVGEGALKLVRDVLEAGTVVDRALRGKLSESGRTALDFESITGSYRITGGVLRTDDLLYRGKDLKVTAAGTYTLGSGRTDLSVVATQGSSQLRAQVTGSGGSLRVIPTGVNIKEPAEVRKFLDRLLR